MSVSRHDIRLSSAQVYLCIVFLFVCLLDKCHYNHQFSCLFSFAFTRFSIQTPSFSVETECTAGHRIKKHVVLDPSG